MSWSVLTAGTFTTVQDAGRPGHAHEGVSPSGWADAPAAELANRLVGNPAGAAVLETTLTGPALRWDGPGTTWVALTGAPAALTVAGRAAAFAAPVGVRAGEVLTVGTAARGLRSYLAVAGGIAVRAVLGSRSTDVLGGLGPDALAAGAVLPVGVRTGPPAAVDVVPVSVPAGGPLAVPRLAVVPGPRAHWLVPGALTTLTSAEWVVDDRSDRVGVRLSGPAIGRAVTAELPSEGMVRGAVQIPPSGQPVVFLADHPVTGGYPVLAVLRESAHAAAAQLRPGARVRFTL